MIGYAETHKAYKLYDLQASAILVSKDVLFCEVTFPYAHIKVPYSSLILPIPITEPDMNDKFTKLFDPIIA